MRPAVPVATLAALLLFPTSAAAGWDESSTTWPMTDAIYDTCNHELVVVNGDWTQSERSRFDDGRVRIETEGRLRNGTGYAGSRLYAVQKTTSSKFEHRADKGIQRTTDVVTIVLRPKDARGSRETMRFRRSVDRTENVRTGESVGKPRDETRVSCTRGDDD